MGELYALRYLSSYFSLLSHSIASQPAGPGNTSTTIQAALSLVKKESLVSIISLLILPEVTIVMSHSHYPHCISHSQYVCYCAKASGCL